MYAIVLAGGYAKRLRPLTLGTPKALLPIAGKPILKYVIDKLQALTPPLNHIILSTNMLFQPQFEDWIAKSAYKHIDLVPDDSFCEKEKPGAIEAMAKIIRTMPDDDVLVIAADGMFNDDLSGLQSTFKKKKGTIVAIYEAESLDEAKRCATVNIDEEDRIIDFNEKPSQPTTTMVCGAVYIFKKGTIQQLKEYLALRLPTDQPGLFIEWLYRQNPVYGYMLKDKLWDVGTPESYQACDEYFRRST